MLNGKSIAEIVSKRFRTPVSNKIKSATQVEFRLEDLAKNEGFYLNLQKQWKRISCETILEPFSKPFLQGIESASAEAKESFISLFKAFSRSHHFTLYIDSKEIKIDEFNKLRGTLGSFQIRQEIKNIDFDDIQTEEVTQICADIIWRSFCLMMVFLHKQILENDISIKEGTEQNITSRDYERNPIYRDIVISLRGPICSCCDLRFEDKYGAYGRDFIEIHHVVPVSVLKGQNKFDPLTDLLPICSNCHSIIHRREVPYTISEIRKSLEK